MIAVRATTVSKLLFHSIQILRGESKNKVAVADFFSPCSRLAGLLLFLQRNRTHGIVYRDKGEKSLNGLYPAFVVHLFKIHGYPDLNAGVADLHHLADQFDKGAGRDRGREIDAVRADRDDFLPGKPGGGDKGCFVHPLEGRAAEQGGVVVGGVGENRFGDAGFSGFHFLGDVHGFLDGYAWKGGVRLKVHRKYMFHSTLFTNDGLVTTALRQAQGERLLP